MRTFSFSGTKSVLSADFYPPLDLRDFNNDFVIGLLSLEVYNAIPNIYKDKNMFYIGTHTIEIPEGTYDIDNINSFLNEKIQVINNTTKDLIFLSLKANLNTLKCELKCTHDVDFTNSNSIGDLLGFHNEKLTKNIKHVSKKPVDIMKVNAIKVLCNIAMGTYDNGKQGHTLHEFFPSVGAGFKIIESPQNVIYLPINTKIINNITFKIVDQDNELLNFRGETITIRAHLKAEQQNNGSKI